MSTIIDFLPSLIETKGALVFITCNNRRFFPSLTSLFCIPFGRATHAIWKGQCLPVPLFSLVPVAHFLSFVSFYFDVNDFIIKFIPSIALAVVVVLCLLFG